jgi:RluA family pseudouridine synthase
VFPIAVIAAHVAVPLADLKGKRDALLARCEAWGLKGAVSLAPEGIDFRVCGEPHTTQLFVDELRRWPGLADLAPRLSGAAQPFPRMIVRVKHRLVASSDPTRRVPEGQWSQCANCKTPLSEAERAQLHFDASGVCPYCRRPTASELERTIGERREQLERLVSPLPGSVARDYFRPINIPGECDGLPLIDALLRIVVHLDAAYWRERCRLGMILDEAGAVVTEDLRVRAGQRLRHWFPGVVEPNVDMKVGVLYEDASIVVLNKPAPLPMHAGGRFVRNTLNYVLDHLYAPQQLRPAHRLDANTTGIVVTARTRYIAGRIQPQFARGDVTKKYLVRVQGLPGTDRFDCDAPISVASGEAGSRFVDTAGGQHARTEFAVLRRCDDGTTLLEARPLTGRTNQIRVHLWHLGLPVCGDQTYLRGGEIGASQTRGIDEPPLCLHAWRIEFVHPVRRERVSFEAPPPAWVGGRI